MGNCLVVSAPNLKLGETVMANFECAVWDILSSSGQCYCGKWWTGVPRRGFSTSSGYSKDLLILQRTSLQPHKSRRQPASTARQNRFG